MAKKRGSAAIAVVLGIVGVTIIGYGLFRKGGVLAGGGLSVAVVTNPITHGASEQINISRATPNGTLHVEILTNTGVDLGLSPDAVAGANGATSYAFTVGTNIPSGMNTVKVTDLTTGNIATATFNVA